MAFSRPGLENIAIITIAIGMTYITYAFDTAFRAEAQQALASNWAHQVSAEVESLSVYAVEHGESNPVAWAVRFLTVGTANRPMEIKTIHFEKEEADWDSETGELLIIKDVAFNSDSASSSDDSRGILIRIKLGYRGFLGAKWAWLSDVYFLCFGLLIWSLLTAYRNYKLGVGGPNQAKYLEKISQMNDSLVQLSLEIKNLLQETNSLQLSLNKKKPVTFRYVSEAVTRTREKMIRHSKSIRQLDVAESDKAASEKW